MADQKRIVLRQGNASPTTIVLESLPVADVASQRLTLRAVSGTTITLAPVRANELGGRIAATEATDVSAIGGTVPVSGDLAATEGLDIAAFSGGVLVAGDLAAADIADTAAAAGSVRVAGVLAATEAKDVFAATGTSAAGTILGDLAATEDADTFAADGRTGRSGNPARITGSARRRRVVRGAAEIGQTGQTVTARGRTIQPDADEDLVLLLAA